MIRFHVEEKDKEVAKEDRVLDCYHRVSKGDILYILYDHDEPVMEVCKDCVIVDP